MAYGEDILDEEIPTPEAIPQGFYASEPALPAGTMNSQVLPQVYGTASDNAYLSEQRALAGLDPRYARQQALMRADMEERALQTQARLEYAKNYKQLIAGGANAAEAHIGAVSSAPVMGLLAQMNMKDPHKLALLAQGNQTGPIQGRPILNKAGEIIGYGVPSGSDQATTWLNTNAVTPDQKRTDEARKRELDDAQKKIDRIYRVQQSAGRLADPNNPEIKAAEAAYETLKQQARTGGKAVEAPAESAKTVIKYDKSGKAWRVDPETKRVIGPA